MHMGHSHSHHIHTHTEELKNKQLQTKKRRRRAALFLFTALAILGPPLFRQRTLTRTDVGTFLLTSTILTMSDTVRRKIQHAIRKIGQLREGIVKHSSPVSPGKFLSYLFRNDNAADRVTLLGSVINLFLSAGKFAVGVSCHSSALIADAGHSLSDLFSDFITLWAVQIGRLPPDDDHPYGHGKFEAIGSLFLSLTLLATGISVGAASNRKLIEIITIQRASGWGTAASLAGQVPTSPALFMAALSIFSKEWLYRITKQVGDRLNSQVILANAWHHRSDAYSSVLALLAIGLAMYFPAMIAADSAAGILVAGMICMTGAEIMGESIKQLTDTSNEALVKKIKRLAKDYSDNVFEVTRVRARQVGSSAIVDVAIATPGELSSSASRVMAEGLRRKIMQSVDVVDAEVHSTTHDTPLLHATKTREAMASNGVVVQPNMNDIEEKVRQNINSQHPKVRSVQGVTVKLAESSARRNSVDVVIRVDPEATVAAAHAVAEDLRKSLENIDHIHQASIFLDLNAELISVSNALKP
jgi:cation diffusion facilitator family transporter